MQDCFKSCAFDFYEVNVCICTLIPALNMVTAVVVLTNALVSGFFSSTLQHSNKQSCAFSNVHNHKATITATRKQVESTECHDGITCQVMERTTTNSTL